MTTELKTGPTGVAVPPLIMCELGKRFWERRWFRRPRRVTALAGLNLELARGEAFGLIGPNGAGKSTTIKLLTGLIFPTAGTAYINGCPVQEARARSGLGFLPENPSLYAHLSAREILTGAAQVHGLKRQAASTRAQGLLEELGLSEFQETPLRKYSKGMVQRAALGHALAGQPELLILDEPLAGLDPVWRNRVVELLASFRDRGGTLLFSSHILADVERLADRVGVLYRGRLREVAPPAALLAEHLRTYILRSQGSPPPAEVPAAREGEYQWLSEVSVQGLWPRLHALEAAGHQLIEVRSAEAGLEDALMRLLSRYEDDADGD